MWNDAAFLDFAKWKPPFSLELGLEQGLACRVGALAGSVLLYEVPCLLKEGAMSCVTLFSAVWLVHLSTKIFDGNILVYLTRSPVQQNASLSAPCRGPSGFFRVLPPFFHFG